MNNTKPLIPGRLININGKVLRIMHRKNGCKGCFLDNPYACPNITSQTIECSANGVIFTQPLISVERVAALHTLTCNAAISHLRNKSPKPL